MYQKEGEGIFHKLLVCSTRHITKEDNEQLLEILTYPDHGHDAFTWYVMETYGFYLIPTYTSMRQIDDIFHDDKEFSKSMMKLLKFAIKRGCFAIRLDLDAPIINSSEVNLHNW